MPIFHDPCDSPPYRQASPAASPSELQSAGSSKDELRSPRLSSRYCSDASDSRSGVEMDSATFHHGRKPSMLDRVELIERIKRSTSPSWSQAQDITRYGSSSEPRPTSRDRPKTPLLPSPDLKKSHTPTPDVLRDNASVGLEIQRPRSALHSGDFRAKKEDDDNGSSSGVLATSPVAPWNRSFTAAAYSPAREESSFSFDHTLDHERRPANRARTISQSSSSFVFMPPTSPLVQQSNNTDLDFSSRPGSRQPSRSPERNNRRHTFSPHSFQSFQSTQMARSASGTPAARHLRKGGTHPYQAHQPRRSLTSFNAFQPHSNPRTPYLNSRRPSFSSEASPLHHAPMVGSYEESILRGRMSTTPSRPLDFVAKIGVLGKGQCKSSLRCPPHVTVPFPAVFYSYDTGNGRITEDSPSPYVGLIDLENCLSTPDESAETSRRKKRNTISEHNQDEIDFQSTPKDNESPYASKNNLRRREKKKRRSTSPKSPPGGSYRIPQQGQLQIVIKNPNKTAVKLFLVPYDLSDMEPGQKTFVRQRSYSAGPIIDMPMSSRSNLGTDRPEASLSNSDDPNDRPILRYLIHLHMCCPSKGRYYLYKSVRVVFANRVPDGKEKLRNEIQLPEPKYSAYKATKDSSTTQNTSSAGAQLVAEKAFRRRSAGVSLSHTEFDRLDSQRQHPSLPPPAVKFTGGPSTSSASDFGSPIPAFEPIPFDVRRLAAIDSRTVSREHMDIDPGSPFISRQNNSMSSPMSSDNSPNQSNHHRAETFEKLRRGDVGYGGNAFRSINGQPASPTAGLLTRGLRGLDVHTSEESDASKGATKDLL